MAKTKRKIDRQLVIDQLIEDLTSWELGNLLGFTREARTHDLRHMTNEELREEAEQACLDGDWGKGECTVTGEEKDPTDGLVEKIIEAAIKHGEDSEDVAMEGGDLGDALRAAFKELDPAARKRV